MLFDHWTGKEINPMNPMYCSVYKIGRLQDSFFCYVDTNGLMIITVLFDTGKSAFEMFASIGKILENSYGSRNFTLTVYNSLLLIACQLVTCETAYASTNTRHSFHT